MFGPEAPRRWSLLWRPLDRGTAPWDLRVRCAAGGVFFRGGGLLASVCHLTVSDTVRVSLRLLDAPTGRPAASPLRALAELRRSANGRHIHVGVTDSRFGKRTVVPHWQAWARSAGECDASLSARCPSRLAAMSRDKPPWAPLGYCCTLIS